MRTSSPIRRPSSGPGRRMSRGTGTAGEDIEFSAAAEYLMDDLFVRMLDNDEPLLTLRDRLVLVELSFAVPAINLKEILFALQLKGYQPVLAHPERYLYFGANKGWYDQLRDAGCLFQLNLMSFSGYYGPESRQLVEYLVKRDMSIPRDRPAS